MTEDTFDSTPKNNRNSEKQKFSVVGIREKLIIIFLIVKIIPLILLAVIAWQALISLGNILRDTSVKDSREALTASAVEKIERISTETAQKVAEFLYGRDADISFIANALEDFDFGDQDSNEKIESLFQNYCNSKTGNLRRHGQWKVADDGMSWVQIDPYIPPQDSDERSRNKENNDTIDGASFHYRPPYGYGDSQNNFVTVPLYDEIALLDKEGNQVVKFITQNSTKKRHKFPKELLNVSDPNNTFVKAEHYFRELSELGKNDIYVSDVIGAYVPSRFIGMYTPDYIASKLIDAKIAELETDTKQAELVWQLRVLNAELKNEEAKFNSKLAHNTKIRNEIDRRLGKEKTWVIKNKNIEQVAEELKNAYGLTELSEAVLRVRSQWKPEEEAYAGAENPLGIRFEGIVRWAKPVLDKNGNIKGYVTFALNHDHLLNIIDHITPMNERFTELSNAFDGNYAFIWDYQCRSVVHPRHHSMYGFNPETGKAETPWLEKTLYDGMLTAGFKREDWQDYIATLKDYESWTGDTGSMAYQSRKKKPAAELTKLGLVGLDGRYLNNAPQCTGWMDLTRDGGSGSFYILWSGLYKLNTAAAIPYYTGHYHPKVRGNQRGFGFVAIGAGIDDFSRPADEMGERLTKMVAENFNRTSTQLVVTTVLLSVLVIFVAIWMASYLSNRLQELINGISKFRSGARYFRFHTKRKDEFGRIADSFDEMADSIVRSVHSPLVITDMNLRIIYANEPSLKVLGADTLENTLGKSYENLSIYPFGTKYCPITALQKGMGKAEVFYESRLEQFLQGNANYFTDENGIKIGYIITSNDVTDLSLKQIEVERAMAAAELASKHKSDFLARMSHELRTPMNAIIGMNNIAQSKISNVQDKTEYKELSEYLFQLKDSSSHLLSLLSDILDISNLETGSIKLINQPLKLDEMFEDITGVLRLNCISKRLELITRFDEMEQYNFIADGLRLRQVLNNILNNAVKYTQEGGKVEFIVECQERRNGKSLISFTVRDTGIGISPDALRAIFRPFEQADSQITRNYGGSGLGLTIAQEILKLFGSEISVTSVLGSGSEFDFAVWLQEDDNANRIVTCDIHGCFHGQKALVVDDVFINRTVLVSLLNEAGFTTVEAKNGLEGVNLFEESPEGTFNVIFMDIQMPVMDGYEAAAAIRRLQRNDAQTIPIVAISANAFREDIDKSIASGMNSHYAKPINMDILSVILMTYCKPTQQPK
ncbi:MAG: response regulator [Planctomycetaceae bacterium]|jgi:signal transduction histidine kinase/CheY-like chemotaxis protein/HAMP domain-containing protein|nr:response regulator [Planctomycetaceae bacterium]